MSAWLKVLIATACCAIIATAGVVTYFQIYPHKAAPQLTATPRQVASCEKQVADAMLYPMDKVPTEGEGRGFAIGLVGCDDYGLLPPSSKAYLSGTKLQPYIEAFRSNRDVWRRQ